MKKNTFTYLLMCCLCAFLLSACGGMWVTEKIRSYVTDFIEPTTFRMELTDRNNILLYWDWQAGGWRWVTFRSRGDDRVRYDELATQYNDLSYNRRTAFFSTEGPDGRTYASTRIVSINVHSDTDFDVEHPAGTSLAGFVRLLSASPMRFIESGYQETFDWHNNYPADFLRETATFHRFIRRPERERELYQNHFPVSGLLSELVPNDFRLLGTGSRVPARHGGWFFGFLVFDKEPENLGTHNLTVTIYRTCGQVLSQTIEKTF